MFLGEDLLAWLLLALGGALFAGNLLALVRPPGAGSGGPAAAGSGGDAPVRAPLARSLVMAAVGLMAAIWALASLIRG